MHSFLKSRWLMSCGAVFALISVSCGPARAEKFELFYRATLNEEPSLLGQPFPVGTPLTITADFDTSSADYWNTGAYIYTALSPTFVIGATTELYEGEPGALLILLSDPSWATYGGPAPYSAGFFRLFPNGAINSVFGSSTASFQAADPSPTTFYDYQSNFSFAGPGPLTVSLSGGQLTLYANSLSDVTAAIFPVPELSTWAMMAFGFAGLGMAGRLRGWRNQSRATTALAAPGGCGAIRSAPRPAASAT